MILGGGLRGRPGDMQNSPVEDRAALRATHQARTDDLRVTNALLYRLS